MSGEAPNTDVPNTDAPNTDAPNTDAPATAPSYGGTLVTLTPTGSRLQPFPRLPAFVLLVAMGVGIPGAPSAEGLGKWAWLLSMLAGTLACCAIATWGELRLYRGLVSLGGIKRLALTLFTPMVFMVVWPVLLFVAGFATLIDDGVALSGVFFGGAWFISAAMGTIVVVLLDIVISATIADFRSRIQAAVLGLLLVSLGFTWTVYATGQRVAAAIRHAAETGTLPGDIAIQLGPNDTRSGERALDLLATAETERFIAGAFVFIAAALGLPAVVSACGKLADSVMERLNPLTEAMEQVSQGDLDVRVEVGGSSDLVQLTGGFNEMASSLTTTLGSLDARNRELVETNEATRRFVPFQFLELLDKKTIRDIERGDQTQLELSIMFCDIRSFTTMAERMGPQNTFLFINRYLAQMEPEIHREHGFISDYIGDGIMALFTGADAALRAALGMLAALERFNQTLVAEGSVPVRIGLGLNSGTIMLGTIGGRDRLSCTVIGDPVNMAARVEGMTKLYGASLLISETTRDRLQDASRYVMREVDRVQAQGKTEPAAIYEVLDGLSAAEREAKRLTGSHFTEGLHAYRHGDFESAMARFDSCVEAAPEDGAALLYVERCARILRRGPPTDWDGISRLDSK